MTYTEAMNYISQCMRQDGFKDPTGELMPEAVLMIADYITWLRNHK